MLRPGLFPRNVGTGQDATGCSHECVFSCLNCVGGGRTSVIELIDLEVGASWFLNPPVKVSALRGFRFLIGSFPPSESALHTTYHTSSGTSGAAMVKVLRLGLILVVFPRVRPRCNLSDRTGAFFACRNDVMGDKT